MAEARRHVELRYDPKEIDRKWQDRWDKDGLHRVDNDDPRPKWYEMTMYPYPSGDLHIGHWYAMAPADCHARFRRMQGYNVLHPIGFDAFGLPAENAAISRGVHPYSWTMSNIENMRKQLRSIGAIYDWDREIVCCLPEYYRWNQWLFLKFFHQGLAYRAKAPVVWCPSCQTVLANEQVINGNCERCGTTITRRDLEQWFFRITQYADRLLDFSGLLDWPNKILTMQTNWIGRSEGVEISFDISDKGLEQKDISTFTTRIDTIFGVTFIVLAPEHPLVADLTTEEHREAVEVYIDRARKTSEIDRLSTETDKTGVFTGSYAINRLNGEKVPIYIGDYVLMTYGTGAVMGVPAPDSRDFVFAQKYRLPVRIVVAPISWDGSELTEAYLGGGFMTNSEAYDGMTDEEGIEAISADIEKKGWGSRTVSYRMRDWLVSRQRYWGTPIPVVYCDKCGIVPVPEDELPVLLPTDAEYIPTGEGSPLASNAGFLNTTCYRCGGPARRETDTMDTFFDSSWYMLRYLSPGYSEGPFDPAVKDWLPVDQYTGGAEHAVMHLLYSRFFIKGLHDMGVVDFEEPFLRLFNQGVILGEDHEKMSKSRGNVVNPDEVVGHLGADAVRCFLMFIGPWDQGGPWSEVGMNGMARWLNRVWEACRHDPSELPDAPADESTVRDLLRTLPQTIRKCHDDLDRFKFNTAIAQVMTLMNVLEKAATASEQDRALLQEGLETVALLLAPITPHISHELWQRLGKQGAIIDAQWPKVDESALVQDSLTLVVQVNGKVRDRLEMPAGTNKDETERLALAAPKVQTYMEGKQIRKVVVVPERLVNIVCG